MKRRKKEATEEQKQAAELRRAAFRELSKRIAAMSPEDRAALAAKVSTILTVKGRPLSPFNSCLVIHQRPDCTVVGGFRQWKSEGRSVRKGERGLAIWVPTGTKGEAPETTAEPAAGDVEGGEKSRSRFICGYVFDVTQTEVQGEKPESDGELDDAIEVEAETTTHPAPVAALMAPADGLVLDGWINSQAKTDPAPGPAIALELELCD